MPYFSRSTAARDGLAMPAISREQAANSHEGGLEGGESWGGMEGCRALGAAEGRGKGGVGGGGGIGDCHAFVGVGHELKICVGAVGHATWLSVVQVQRLFCRPVHAAVRDAAKCGVVMAACTDGVLWVIDAKVVDAQLSSLLFKIPTNRTASLVSVSLSETHGRSAICGFQSGLIEVWAIYDVDAAQSRRILRSWSQIARFTSRAPAAAAVAAPAAAAAAAPAAAAAGGEGGGGGGGGGGASLQAGTSNSGCHTGVSCAGVGTKARLVLEHHFDSVRVFA